MKEILNKCNKKNLLKLMIRVFIKKKKNHNVVVIINNKN